MIFAVDNNAPDLHLSARAPPTVRIHGEMRKFEMPAMFFSRVDGAGDAP